MKFSVYLKYSLFLCLVIGKWIVGNAQDSLALVEKVTQFPERFLNRVASKVNHLEDKVYAYSEKSLAKLEKQELRLKKKLAKKDSLAAEMSFGDIKGHYQKLREGFNAPLNKVNRIKEYLPGFDTLKTSLKFLSTNYSSLINNNEQAAKLKEALSAVNGLDQKLQGADAVRAFLKERREVIKEQLNRFGMLKELQQYNKQVYYYTQQIKEYKEILQDEDKLERKALEVVSKTRFFNEFLQKNSELASLFNLGSGGNAVAGASTMVIPGNLQTRTQVQQLIQQQMASAGTGGMTQLQQNLQGAQTMLQNLKNKLNAVGNGSSDMIMPEGFKPKELKTKSLWQRIELGTNIQSQRTRGLLPANSEFALSAGYKINPKSVVGIAGVYKLGWGQGINNIHITHEGLGARSFLDIKLKNTFWMSGGYEMTYRSAFTRYDQLKNYDAWKRTGLLGVSKIVSIKSKVFKKTKVQLLWDFLSQQQVPVTEMFLFRVGYDFH